MELLAIGIGAGYLALGIVGVATTGVPLGHLDRPAAEVLGFRHTPLLGLAELAFGALLAAGGVVAGGARSLMALLGVITTSLGVMVLVDVAPLRLHDSLGAGGSYGWLSVIVGVFLVVTALYLPDVAPRDPRMTGRHVVR